MSEDGLSDTTPEGYDVAIACQGGGSHTAFTAGVLCELLHDLPPECNLVGLSGTSGGAACASLAWYGLVDPTSNPESLLTDFWDDLSANTPLHRATNNAIKLGIKLQRSGIPLPDVSPSYSPVSRWAEREMRQLLESYIDFESISADLEDTHPALFLSSIDVLSGSFEVFREADLSVDAILASAAEPHIFEAVEKDGRYYWDGLFSKNPPIIDFMDAEDVPDPDEIWLVKINPQERDSVPTSPEGIDDRRNELSGNLSLNAEIRFLNQVNEWVEKGYLPEKYTHTEIRRIRFQKGRRLDWRTKLDRDPEFIQTLIENGRNQGRTFLENWQPYESA